MDFCCFLLEYQHEMSTLARPVTIRRIIKSLLCWIPLMSVWQMFWDHQSTQRLSTVLGIMSLLPELSQLGSNQSDMCTTLLNMVVYQWLTLHMESDAIRNESNSTRRWFTVTKKPKTVSAMKMFMILKRLAFRIWSQASNASGCVKALGCFLKVSNSLFEIGHYANIL